MRDKTAAGSFLERLLKTFGINDPNAEKKRLLKAIGKDLSKSRYRFYKPKTTEALPGLAKFFYETYKVIAPAQVILTNASQSGVLKSFVIESFLSKEQLQMAEQLTESSIQERAATYPIKQLQELLKQDMATFFAIFDSDRTNQIDSAYATLLSFILFISFDYFFLLKKFDSNVSERNFTYTPRFDSISIEYIVDDIHDFLEIFLPLNLDTDWKRIFTALKGYRNMDVIHVDSWVKLAAALKDVRTSGILEQLVRHAKQDPYMTFTAKPANERIVEPFIEKIRNQTTMTLQKISRDRRNSRIDELVKAIFGTNVVVRLKNYTDKANIPFGKKLLGGFVHTQALNYLKAYLIDYFKKDIRELVDSLLIRGQWSTNVQSQQLSDAYHALMDVSEQIIQFDESLADDAELGTKLRNLLNRSDRDKDALKFVRQLLKDINERALGYINKSALNMITVGRQLKAMIDDVERAHHEIIVNWKDVETAYGNPMKESLVEHYKKLYFMVQLLQFYVKEDKE
jgi:hypothetical protein